MKHIEPRYQGVEAAEVPAFTTGAAAIRLLARELDGATGPIALAHPALLLHVKSTASPGGIVALPAGKFIVLHFAGPFVMDTSEHLEQAQRDFYAGRMGTLDGVPY